MTATVQHPEPLDVPKPADTDIQLVSVTTIIGALDKPALLYWAAEQTADAAIDNLATWQAMLEDSGRAEAVKYLRDARFRKPKTTLASTDLGTIVHELCESYALTGNRPTRDQAEHLVEMHAGGPAVDIPAEVRLIGQMVNQFDSWVNTFQPVYIAAEMTVYDPARRYAGTLDAIMEIDGVRFIADYKTSREPLDSRGKPRTPYPEQVALQLAAYRNAPLACPVAGWRPRRFERYRRRYYLLSPDEQDRAVQVPTVDTGLVIHITPAACDAYMIECGTEPTGDDADRPSVYEYFTHALHAFHWLDSASKRVMEPLVAPAGQLALGNQGNP